MEPHKIILGILLFCFVIFSGIYVMFGSDTPSYDEQGLFDDYGVSKDAVASKLENITKDQMDNIEDNISFMEKESRDDMDPTSGWRVADIGPIKSLRRMFGFFTSIGAVSTGVAEIVKTPPFIADYIMVALEVIVLFIIIYMILKFQPRSS